jgi:hypothetical protein
MHFHDRLQCQDKAAEPAPTPCGRPRGGAAWPRAALLALACGWSLSTPMAARAQASEAPEPAPAAAAAAPPEANLPPVGPETNRAPVTPEASTDPPPEPPDQEVGWVDDRRLALERGLGTLVDRFDRFFGDERSLDVESPSTRFRFKGLARTAEDRELALGVAVGVSFNLPRLERLLANARLVLVGENASAGAPVPPIGNNPPNEETSPVPPAGGATPPTDLSRSRGRAELRFDLFRSGELVLDTGGGVTFAWPPVPFVRVRGHLRFDLGAGLTLRATEVIFAELGGRGLGTNTDLVVDRFLGSAVRLRVEGHGLFAQTTRGVEWSALAGAEWRVHPRTGLFSGVGSSGVGTPSPGLDVWRIWVGVRQDLWRGWVFAELEPEIGWPRPAGMSRSRVLAATLRLELVIEGRASSDGASR